MKHSPEPWKLSKNDEREGFNVEGYSAIRPPVAPEDYEGPHNMPIVSCDSCMIVSKPNAERIVACVNALAGIEEVENKVALWKAFERGATAELDKAVELDAAVQELIDAAKALYPRVPQNDMDDEDFPLMGRIAAAILKLDPTWGVP